MAEVYLERDEGEAPAADQLLTRHRREGALHLVAHHLCLQRLVAVGEELRRRVASARNGRPIHARIWIDQELKKKMGY
jgi:hypothetical protein